METDYLTDIIGQKAIKARLNIYKNSYQMNGVIPFILMEGSRGGGKTKLTRDFRETLVRPDGTTPPMLEVNGASIKSADSFFEQIFPVWESEGACLFIDEIHKIHPKLETIFLTALEKSKNPVRNVSYDSREGIRLTYTFDFRKMSFISATTDRQQLSKAFNDRLTKIPLAGYSDDELFQIFKLNCDTNVDTVSKDLIKSRFRGHPRNCCELAENLDFFAAAHGVESINDSQFNEFCLTMAVFEHGLDESEMQILKILSERGEMSLNGLAAATMQSRQVVQKEYESILLQKGLMDISGKRSLTQKGREFSKRTFKG